jgi:EAL domain-containing protein (putative c-di-GMP-specific phosphodiesterase class I)
MLSAIIGLSRAFGMQVLAEGIETEDQGLHLLQLGCMHGQGYAIARPMPAEHIEEWCKNWQPPARWSSTGV